MKDKIYCLIGPLNPNDQVVTGSYNINEPGLYTIASTTYRATRGADGDFEGTMRERCTNCGGSRKGIGIALYSHPWCMACLRSFNEDGTFKESMSPKTHQRDKFDIETRQTPESYVATHRDPEKVMQRTESWFSQLRKRFQK